MSFLWRIIAILPSVVAAAPEPSSDLDGAISVFDSRLYGAMFGPPEMRAVFNDRAMVEQWLTVEVTLARTQAELGLIPISAADAITRVARIENIDFEALGQETRRVGRGIAPMLTQLRQQGGSPVADYLHWGSTTQDIMDTATVLQVRSGLALIRRELVILTLAVADLALTHRDTLMVARTNGQDAVPTTFGLHLTTYLAELARHVRRLDEVASRLTVQFGSTVGTLAPYGEDGLKLQAALAEALGLSASLAPWNPSRDTFAEVVQTLALIDATLGRVADDINVLSRNQIDEVREGQDGPSSTMPQKHNPRASEFLGGLARMGRMLNAAAPDMMSHSDTRQGAPWILEWSVIPESFLVAAAAIDRAQGLFAHLIVNPDRMKEHLDTAGGFVMSEAVMNALAGKLGRAAAYDLMKTAIAQAGPGDSLAEVIAHTPELDRLLPSAERVRLLDPRHYLGAAGAIVDRTVTQVRVDLSP